jgi:hypothetical protein
MQDVTRSQTHTLLMKSPHTHTHPFPIGLHLTSLALVKAGSHYCKALTTARLPPAHRIAPPQHAPCIGPCPTPPCAPTVRHHPSNEDKGPN